MIKRFLSVVLCFCLCLSLFPAVYADGEGLCPNHTEHIDCGYVQAEEAQPCTHSCELCKPVGDDVEEEDEPASQQPSDIYPACEHHVHDESCGGLVNACTFVCETCIAEINALLASIPSPITDANREQVASILSAIDAKKYLISDNAVNSIDWQAYDYAALVLSTPKDWFGIAIQKRMDVPSEGVYPVFSLVNANTGAPAVLYSADGASTVTAFPLTPNVGAAVWYLPAGTYTLVESVNGSYILSTTVNGVAAPGNTFTGNSGDFLNIVAMNSYGEINMLDTSMTLTPEKAEYTGSAIEADVAKAAGISGMGDFDVKYIDASGNEADPIAAGTYTVVLDVQEGKNYKADSALTDSTWSFEIKADPADTENTEKVKDINKDNVKTEDKTDLENAKKDLEDALNDPDNKYTDEQKKDIQDDIDRIDDALEAIENAEKVNEAIENLPDDAKPDDQEVKDAKDAFDALTDNEKNMVSDENKAKLESIVDVAVGYKIIYGNFSYWYKNNYYGLGFTCDGPFDKFTGIKIDGFDVAPAYYSAVSGSTVVTLYPQLLNLLNPGPHSITFTYTDGSATGYFYVLTAPINAVATGDDSHGGLISSVMGLSLMGFALSFKALRRKEREN